jgi:hypothetical protein
MRAGVKIVIALFALGLGILGGQLIVEGPAALSGIGHTSEALPQVLGGRFIAVAALVLALVMLEEWRATALALAAAASMGIIDRFVEPSQYGATHLGFAAVCLALAAAAFVMSRRP